MAEQSKLFDEASDTCDELIDRFDAHKEEFLAWDKVKVVRSQRREVHAIMLVDELFPRLKKDRHDSFLDTSEMDDVYPYDIAFNVPMEKLSKLTDDQIIELQRCGVCFDGPILRLAICLG